MSLAEDGRQPAPPIGGPSAQARGMARNGGGSAQRPCCCPLYHEAIELIGRRWTGAIVSVLLVQESALRFGEIGERVPELSDRLLSERMKELESRGVVCRTVRAGRPVRVEYALTEMGRELAPAVQELERWARRWLSG
jgi:DNA-binding HxlR family transcriptional regulator